MTSGAGRARQEQVYRDGVSGSRPRVPTTAGELERRGRRAMSRRADAYVTGGAGAETTVRANRDAFARREIVPRILSDVGERDLSVELYGRRLPAPLLLAPIGALDLVRRGADTAVARGAAAKPGFALAREEDARAVLDPRRDVHREAALARDAPGAAARGAGVVDHLAAALAGMAGAFEREKALRVA